jgi:hypothetical protein
MAIPVGQINCSLAATDRRHVFNLSAVAAAPQFSNPWLHVLGTGWRFSPILKLLSGQHLTATTTQDRSLNGIANQLVDQTQANIYGDGSIKKFLNPAAFAQSAFGTFGNAGRGSILGPGTWQFDVALARSFQIREAQRVEFRAEAFNLTNSFRMTDPNTVVNSNTFGQVTSALDPRIMQFALKYFF